ncbi:hypothetical protein [Amycolatopsis regifaucium]|uniref:Uncharacterized protein n=1 Tax=Amycolatopsis regifaucium TaxID=546365 RepID=A0A154MQZ4_9PSEU|nr:hypothetical protein [Amycolatopsis regifaucium]KZB86363.1 hypothetical protein AVL48_26565 [Amycolatopsis regifaucium]OKA06448.1 hypothetical protein ATP06_0225385 [Amycolatopsis regifaucium]SFJ26923.1 hypothetical protein SAMN04489731_1188 [Amycolatopsis regifaucium]
MEPELSVYVRGDPDSIDAGQVLAGLRSLLALLGALQPPRAGGQHVAWRFSKLRLNSVETQIAALDMPPGIDADSVDAMFQALVRGIHVTETAIQVPSGWNAAAVDAALKASDALSSATAAGTEIGLVHDDSSRVVLTAQTAKNLKALRVRRSSIGSVIGHLESLTLHQKRECAIWTDRRGERVVVKFGPEQQLSVQQAMGKRVQARGVLQRDYRGRPMVLDLAALEILPEPDQGRLLSEAAGEFPDFTGGVSVRAYLESVRGTS